MNDLKYGDIIERSEDGFTDGHRAMFIAPVRDADDAFWFLPFGGWYGYDNTLPRWVMGRAKCWVKVDTR